MHSRPITTTLRSDFYLIYLFDKQCVCVCKRAGAECTPTSFNVTCTELTAHIVRIGKNTENENGSVMQWYRKKGRLSICWFNKYLPKSNQLHMFRSIQHSVVNADDADDDTFNSISFRASRAFGALNKLIYSIR